MKKYAKIAYLVVGIIILIIGFFTYKVFSKNDSDNNIKSKSLSEVRYLDNKFMSLFNAINNISFENYKISATEIKEEESENQDSNTSGNSKSSNSEKSKKEGSSSSQSSEESKDNKKYDLKEQGILTKEEDINWDYIKNEVEKIYTSLYSTTIDLYQTETNQDDIVNFNKEYDNLTKVVKDENKENTLMELSKLYDYLPKFVESIAYEEKDKVVIKTKNEIFKAYSILDREEWSTISEKVNNASQEFTKLITNVNNQEKVNQYNLNKAYIMINELQNAVILEDKEVFLIKYKNLLEELQNI